MELTSRLVVVVGLGKSGVAAARLALARGARVVATDSAPLERLSPDARALPEVVAGGHEGAPLSDADLVVISPGVPSFPELERAERSGVPVIGEIEFASRFVAVPIVAIGGTNGKSTTTLLTARLLEAAGLRAFAGGNLGTPLSDAVGGPWDVLVVEVSSFQLERVPTLRPRVCVLLNITADHLDRYASFDDYARAKGNAFSNQADGDIAVVPEGDAVVLEQAKRGKGALLTFGASGDYRPSGRSVEERASGCTFSLENTELHGAHHVANAAAAIAAARTMGASDEGIREGLVRFRALAHRTTRVASVRGVTFYDDSKGTNVGAAVTAVRGTDEPRVVLIAGGRDKQGSYEPLVSALREKGRAVVLIGEAAARIAAAVGEAVPALRAATMEEAVRVAFSRARPGDAVLLSPACSSFDMFESYAHRGDEFVAAVRALEEVLEGG